MSTAGGSWNLPKQLNELRMAEELPENLASHISSLLLSVGEFTDVTSLKMTRKKKQTTTKNPSGENTHSFLNEADGNLIISPSLLFEIEHRLSFRRIHHLCG